MKTRIHLLAGSCLAALLALTVAILRREGHRWWCRLGDWPPWSWQIHDEHTSQHFLDLYSLTHVLHGLPLYAGLRLVGGRFPREARLLGAIALECLWEVVENSRGVIDRYRAGTIALGYDGDSILNSLGDVASCGLGFRLAGRLPVRGAIALFFVVEVALLVAFRDNLLLNMIMLIHSFDFIKTWQAVGL